MRPALIATLSIVLCAQATAAQQAAVRGRVIERGTALGISGALVELGAARVLTATDGAFTLSGPAGRYILTARAMGYAPAEVPLVLSADTVLLVELDRAPIALDTLAARARFIDVTGTVYDASSGMRLIDVDVFAAPDRQVLTDPGGRFKLERVPAHVPLTLQVSAFGYLPRTIMLEAASDTTLRFDLEADSLALRMIAEQKEQIADRSSERRHPGVPVISRMELLRNVNRSTADVLREFLRSRFRRIRCIIIDERMPPLAAQRLERLLPDRVEHIEILSYGPVRSQLMVRIYTRDFFRSLVGRGAALEQREELMHAARTGWCE